MNEHKAMIMPLFRRQIQQTYSQFPIVKTFKYLGMTISSNRKINSHLNDSIKKMKKIANTIQGIRSQLILPLIKTDILKYYLKPVFTLVFIKITKT